MKTAQTAIERVGTGTDILRKLVAWKAGRLKALMKRSALVGDPRASSAKAVGSAVCMVAVLVPASALLAAFLGRAAWVIALAPLAAYFAPELRLRDAVAQRKEGVEKELPFFSVLVSVLGSAGVPLYAVFEGLARNEIFDSMKKEALLVKRDVEVLGANSLDSFEKLAADHPSRRFAGFLLGYTSKIRSGGDIGSYLGGESGALLRELEGGWSRYVARVGAVGSLMVTVFGVVPLLLLTVGFFSPQASVTGLTVFALVGVPGLAAALVLMAGRMQPTGERPLHGALAKSLLAGGAVGGLGAFVLDPWEGVAAALLAFFSVYGLSVRGPRLRRDQIDAALPRFLEDLMQYKRQEYDLTRSVQLVASTTHYNAAFDHVLSKIAAALRAGVPLDEVQADPGTRLSRLAFFVLGQMAYSGGGSLDTMFQLTSYTSKVVEMKDNTRSETRPYLFLSYVTPLLLVLGIAFVGGVMANFGGAFRAAGVGASSAAGRASVGGLLQVSKLLIVISAGALGVVGAKMTDFTVRNTLRASLNIVIAVVAASLVPVLSAIALHGAI